MSSDKFGVELSDKDPSSTLRMACVLNTLHLIILPWPEINAVVLFLGRFYAG